MLRFRLALLLTLLCSPAWAEEIAGRASVIDGDTIEIHGERIRLLDIDAPESRQLCTMDDGSQWRCGQAAALALADFIGQHTVTCQAKKRDRYGRWLARCSANNEDLSIWLAWNGWAMAYRDCRCEDIRDATGRAASKQIGIWATTFIEPWRWRRGER